MIKLIILDSDGIMNDGRKYYDQSGKGVLKQFCDKDFTAIKRLKAAGTEVVFLSGDQAINEAMAKNRNIPFYNSRKKLKLDFFKFFMDHYGLSETEICFIGDDLFDLPLLKVVGHPFCPNDACHDVLEYIKSAHGDGNVVNRAGGFNVIEELHFILKQRTLVKEASLEDIERLEAKETF